MGRERKREIVHRVRNIAGAWKAWLGYAFVNQTSEFSEFTSNQRPVVFSGMGMQAA